MKSVYEQVWNKPDVRVRAQVRVQVWDQVWNQVRLEIEDQMFDQAVFHVYVYDQVIHL